MPNAHFTLGYRPITRAYEAHLLRKIAKLEERLTPLNATLHRWRTDPFYLSVPDNAWEKLYSEIFDLHVQQMAIYHQLLDK